METTTTHKPIKIRAGVYNYRGVTIAKSHRYGFCATAYTSAGWHRLGLTTLANCVIDIENALLNGATIDGTRLTYIK